jgi:hypothetical protein
MQGTISLPTSSTGSRNMAETEGSVTLGPLSPATVGPPSWQTISQTYYNSWVRNGATGAKNLQLPLIAVGGSNPDLVRRPLHNEDANSIVYNERLFSKASIRILLSDTLADFQNLPTVTATAPIMLEGNWNTGYPAAVGAFSMGPLTTAGATSHPPVALSPGNIAKPYSSAASGTITFANTTDAAAFKPTFYLSGFPNNLITCAGKTPSPIQLTGCIASPGPMPAFAPLMTANLVTPAQGALPGLATGISSSITSIVATNITFSNAAGIAPFNVPTPLWDGNTLITCTGWTSLTYTGCSSNPTTGTLRSQALSNPGTGLIGGYIKIEVADAAGNWTDVTTELLSFGFGAANLAPAAAICADPSPNAIIRLQRLRDNTGVCNYNTDTTGAKDPTNWWPNALFDTREALVRDADPGTGPINIPLGGVMYYATLDVKNLAKWFRRAAPYATGSGNIARTDNGGYTVYFSDRRNNRNASNEETGEYGWEDVVNTGAAGAANGNLETGEDFNGNGTLETYGSIPNYGGTANTPVPGAVAPLTTTARPTTLVSRNIARINRPILFRRALKLVRGDGINSAGLLGNVLATERISGLTIVSENPVYVEGNWNAYDAASYAVNAPHAATAIIADAITVLSTNWQDISSFTTPYINPPGAGRLRPTATESYYRFAALAGKGIAFPEPTGANSVFGTDGGAHNFLRMLEGDNAQTTVNYRGSMASFFFSRQAVGSFKCCSGQALDGVVYSVPIRQFSFDTDFLTPSLLPPNTPMFRDMNAVGFSQQLKPGK